MGALVIIFRCEIPECDSNVKPEFSPQWLRNAVPFDQGQPKSCSRYQYYQNETRNTFVNDSVSSDCPIDNFDHGKVEICDKFVYKSPEITISHDVGMLVHVISYKISIYVCANVKVV